MTNNPDIFGPVGTVWTVDFSGGRGVITTIELRKDTPEERVYARSAGGHKSRSTEKKGFVVGGAWHGKMMTDLDLWIVGVRRDYLRYATSDSIFSNPLSAVSPGTLWLHKDFIQQVTT